MAVGARNGVTLACTECKQRNYQTKTKRTIQIVSKSINIANSAKNILCIKKPNNLVSLLLVDIC